MPEPTISVVVVNWNSADDLDACLASLCRQRDRAFETIVADNGSADGSVDMVHAKHPWARVIEAGANLGFAEACNVGIEASRAEWVATLNNDAEADPGWIAALREGAVAGREALGMIQSRILFRDDPPRINSTGVLIFTDGCSVDRDYGRPAEAAGAAGDVFCATAGAALYRRRMLDEVRLPSGYFDRDHFMYFEDVDLGWRCRLAGWEAIYLPAAIVRHRAHASASRRGRYFVKVQCKKNHIRTLVKNASLPFMARSFLATGLDWVRIPFMGGPGALVDLLRTLPRALAERGLVSALSRVPRRDVERRWARPSRQRT
jgi:GT2 family glycosyltransferase